MKTDQFMALAFAVPIALDGITQRLRLRKSNNVIRIITGYLLGAAFAMLILFSLQTNMSELFKLVVKETILVPGIETLLFSTIAIAFLVYFYMRPSAKAIYIADRLLLFGAVLLSVSLAFASGVALIKILL